MARILATTPPTTTVGVGGVGAASPEETMSIESDLVAIMAGMVCALICVVGVIGAARCTCLRPTSSPPALSNNNKKKGLKKNVICSLPKFTYGSSSSNSKRAPVHSPGSTYLNKWSEENCAICLGEFFPGEEVRVLPPCAHAFHVPCVDTWLASHSSCPSCRQNLLLLPTTTAAAAVASTPTWCQNCRHFPPAPPTNNHYNTLSSSSASYCGGDTNQTATTISNVIKPVAREQYHNNNSPGASNTNHPLFSADTFLP